MRNVLLVAYIVAALLASAGCRGDYVARTGGVRQSYESYDYARAIDELDRRVGPDDTEEDHEHPDRLLYLMDRGMILHSAGRYEESNEALHEAERVAAALDIVSVSEEARILASNPRGRAYRGEDYELLLINVLKALNFAALNRVEPALVEVRRAHERLRAIGGDEDDDHHRLAVATYVAGVLWEWAGEMDSAFIDYRRALTAAGELEHLVEPLLRLAYETGRSDVYEDLVARHPDVDHDPLGPDEGQVVVVISAGRSPMKKPTVRSGDVDLFALPYYQSRSWPRSRARVRVAEADSRAVTLTSIEKVAPIYLKERVARMVGKSVASAAVKVGLATAIGAATGSEDLGLSALYLLMASNRPDLRSWLSLPAEFQIARFRLPAGEHDLEVFWGGETVSATVTVIPGEISLVPLRLY